MAVYRRECRDRLGKAARLWWRYAIGALTALVITALGSFGQRLFCSHAPKRTNHHHNHTDFLSTATHNLNPLFNESETVVGNRTGWTAPCIGRNTVSISKPYNYSLNYSFANSWKWQRNTAVQSMWLSACSFLIMNQLLFQMRISQNYLQVYVAHALLCNALFAKWI